MAFENKIKGAHEANTMDGTTGEGCIVLDNGEHTIKAGWKGSEASLVSVHTVVGRPRHRGVASSFGPNSVFCGADAQAQREILSLKSPIRRGVVVCFLRSFPN